MLSTLAWTFSNSGAIQDSIQSIENLSLKDSMILGGVLSCTEMVVTLSVVTEFRTPKLHSILFGEDLINTAVSILLVGAVTLIEFTEFTTSNFFIFFAYFLYNCVVSVILGVGFGLASSLLTKHLGRIKNNPSKEVALQFYVGWTGYLIAQLLSVSGVITILISAIISGHYAYYNMVKESRTVVTDTFHLIGDGTRALIFSYLGLTCFSYPTEDISYSFVFLMLVSIAATRFVSIFGIAFVFKIFSKKYDFNTRHLLVV